ncbi:MAG: flagellar export chaperone FliS [Oscillospiraceae bacterium]|jgi:flagellar protein FliS|nr:flagellar export chaperone FliS [Oscillospiraceae bacterium]
MVAYASAGNQYRQQSAMTASPGELTLMLYDGCIKNLKLAKIHIDAKDYAKANDVLQKAQGILAELIRSLDMHYDLSKQLVGLYNYIIDAVVWANVKKDAAKADEALGFITELRDTWQEAVRINRRQTLSGGIG